MAYLVDTSILARLANTADTFYPVATRAVLELHRHGELTFNASHFARLATFGTGITVVDPASV